MFWRFKRKKQLNVDWFQLKSWLINRWLEGLKGKAIEKRLISIEILKLMILGDHYPWQLLERSSQARSLEGPYSRSCTVSTVFRNAKCLVLSIVLPQHPKNHISSCSFHLVPFLSEDQALYPICVFVLFTLETVDRNISHCQCHFSLWFPQPDSHRYIRSQQVVFGEIIKFCWSNSCYSWINSHFCWWSHHFRW